MIRDFIQKIFSIKTTPRGIILTFMGEEYVPLKSIEALVDKNKILEASLDKRIMTIRIMEGRLKQNKDLIEKMHQVLDAQNRQMHEQLDIINNQRRQLKHIDQIDWRMNKLKHEQKKIIKYTNG